MFCPPSYSEMVHRGYSHRRIWMDGQAAVIVVAGDVPGGRVDKRGQGLLSSLPGQLNGALNGPSDHLPEYDDLI